MAQFYVKRDVLLCLLGNWSSLFDRARGDWGRFQSELLSQGLFGQPLQEISHGCCVLPKSEILFVVLVK